MYSTPPSLLPPVTCVPQSRLAFGTNCGKAAGVVWKKFPCGGSNGSQTVPRECLKLPKRFSKGKPEAASEAKDAAEGLPKENPEEGFRLFQESPSTQGTSHGKLFPDNSKAFP